jgi:homoserine kinase
MIQIRIPATTANLGPGYDCMGLALDLWNTFELRMEGPKSSVRVDVLGEGEGVLPTDASNLVYQIIRERMGSDFDRLDQGLHLRCHAGVPCASGLGSSSTAVLAATAFAHALRLRVEGVKDVEPEMLDRMAILTDAVETEGHGDNVGPAMLGGLLLIMPKDHGVIVRQVPFSSFRVVVCVPDFEYLTVQARARLPKSVSHSDAVFNLGRAMFVLQALRDGDDDLLREACDDRLHEPYRTPDIPGAQSAREAARNAGAIAVALSGAGPGVVAFAREGHSDIGRAMQEAFKHAGLTSRWWALDATTNGSTIRRLP